MKDNQIASVKDFFASVGINTDEDVKPKGDILESFDDLPDETELEKETEEVETPKEEFESEEPKVEPKEVKTETPKVEETPSQINYTTLTQKLIKNGMWVGIEGFTEEDEEGNISFNEDFVVDEEMFYDIQKQQAELVKQQAVENKVSIDKVSPLTQKIIELDLNGGDVTRALEAYDKFINPLQGLDPNNAKDAQEIILFDFQLNGKSPEEALEYLEFYESKLKTKSEAQKLYNKYTDAFDKFIEQENKKAEAEKAQKQEEFKEFKKNLRGALTSKFKVNKNFENKVAKIYEKNDNGVSEFDVKIKELTQDPEKAAELALFVLDTEEYLNQKFDSYKTNIQLKQINKNKIKVKSPTTFKKEKEDALVDFNNLIDKQN